MPRIGAKQVEVVRDLGADDEAFGAQYAADEPKVVVRDRAESGQAPERLVARRTVQNDDGTPLDKDFRGPYRPKDGGPGSHSRPGPAPGVVTPAEKAGKPPEHSSAGGNPPEHSQAGGRPKPDQHAAKR